MGFQISAFVAPTRSLCSSGRSSLVGDCGLSAPSIYFTTATRTRTTNLNLFPVVDVDHVNLMTLMHYDNLPNAIASSMDATMHLADVTVDAVTTTGSERISSIMSSMTSVASSSSVLTPEMEEASLDALGHDLLLFLAASVVVEPLGKFFKVTPVLLYLALGGLAGPHGLGGSLFSGETEVDAQIGDFGILFLLFVEGLNLSRERLKALGSFFSLGAAQLLLSVGVIFFGFFFGGPYLLPLVQSSSVPIDASVLELLDRPVVAFSIAAAGALSSSAFVLPVLKEKGWEDRPDGIAALSILLLQDLAVAPLLVVLPLLVANYDESGNSATADPAALAILLAKATFGFGGVIAIASVVLRRIFQIVASYGSSQTFVAASLLVAVGMGVVADELGLSATTGAFAAGVLLAESGYRAQIEADIRPFEGILLGVFFITAGASLDPTTVVEQWPTLLVGISAFLAVKVAIVFAAGEFALGLTRADSARLALLLAGGGEFAFVVFKLAEKLGVLPPDLAQLLTASVIISMSLTPLLGEVAEWAGDKLTENSEVGKNGNGEDVDEDYVINMTSERRIREAFELFDSDGDGSISAEELRKVLTKPSGAPLTTDEVQAVISQYDDNDDGELQFDEFAALWTAKRLTEEERNKSGSGLARAIVVCGYGEVGQDMCAVLDKNREKQSYVALDLDPSRISQGALNSAPVVYGDGASSALVKAVGVEQPAAIAITYNSETRCLEATKRLRDGFPESPIIVRAARKDRVEALMQAGATEVVVESTYVAEGLSNVLDIITQGTSDFDRGSILLQSVEMLINEKNERTLPIPNEVGEDLANLLELTDLAEECGKSREELQKLYMLFSTSPIRNTDGKVQLAELRNELMRLNDAPLDDRGLAAWMGYDESLSKWVTGDAETQWVSFSEFVRFSLRSRVGDEDNLS